MKLNLGSGWKYLDGWVNCDLYAEKVDVRADCRALPFADNTFDEILFSHCIEHITRADGLTCLRELYRACAPGGSVIIETPDRLKLIKLVKGHGPKSAEMNIVEGTRATQGGYYPNAPRLLDGVKGAMGGVSGTREEKTAWHKWLIKHADRILHALKANDMTLMPKPETIRPGEEHLYLWTAAELTAAMVAVGFKASIQDPQGHGQRSWRDCRVVGVKPCE